jgi:hypothetical protein
MFACKLIWNGENFDWKKFQFFFFGGGGCGDTFTVQYSTVQYSTVQYSTIKYNLTVIDCGTAPGNLVLHF